MQLSAKEICEKYNLKDEELPRISELGFQGVFGLSNYNANGAPVWEETEVEKYLKSSNNLSSISKQSNIEALIDLGADIKETKQSGLVVLNTFSTWIAFLKHKYGDALAVDVHDPMRLYQIIENTPDAFKAEELPATELLIKELHDNYDVQSSSLRQSLDAFRIADVNLRQDVNNQYNFFEEQLKRMKNYWEENGSPDNLDNVFIYLFDLTDTDYHKAVARDWFNGAIYNMTKKNYQEPYIRSLDILDTEGGSGKSSFIEYSNALILGLPGKKSATFNFDVNNDFMYSMLVGAPFIHDAELRMSRRASKGSGADDEKGAAWKDFTAQPDYSFQQKGRNETTNVAHYFTVVRSSNKLKVYGDIMANEIERRFMPLVSHRRKSDMLFSGENWAEDYRNYLKLVWGQAYAEHSHPTTQMSAVIAGGAQTLQQQGADGYVITDNLSNLLNAEVPPTINSMPLVQAATVLSDIVITGEAKGFTQTQNWKPYADFDVLKQNVLISAMKKIMQNAKLNITNQEKLTNMIDGYVTRYGFSNEAVHRNLKIDEKEHQQANYYEKVDTIPTLLAKTNQYRDELIGHFNKTNSLNDTEFNKTTKLFLEKVQELTTYNASYALDYLSVLTNLMK